MNHKKWSNERTDTKSNSKKMEIVVKQMKIAQIVALLNTVT
ncbi:MAG: hypothetical protein QMC36_00775 [Patescibacteria group bacterium]